ncbi:MAG: hypothetical protein OEV93_03500 [Candidatus Moranbacteria bacterium]|nr:hypothetical protein [Candidatus Moranbacteria bacterium]
MENNLLARKIFFWFLVLLFLITAPIISFYALGYRFSFEKGIFVYSGSFTIKSTPQESEIHVNGSMVPKGVINFLNYSYHIDGIKPGTYFLEVKKDKYQTWHKESPIHSGLSTEFWNVFLAREDYTKKQYETNLINDFFISPKENNIATVHNDTGMTVRVLDLKTEDTQNVFVATDYLFPIAEKINIEWSPRGELLIIPAINNETGERNYFIAGLENEEIVDLQIHTKEKEIKDVRWDPSDKNFIIYIANDNLYRINIRNNEEKNLITENVGGYDISNNRIYYINKTNGIISETGTKNTDSETQITSTSLENINFENTKIIVYDKDRIGIITGDKDLYVLNNGKSLFFNKISNNVSGLHFSNDGKKMTYWTENEIFVYFTTKWETQPVREENQIIHITRSFNKINNVQWLRDYEHIIYSAGNTVKLIEIDHRDYRNLFDILELNNPQPKIVYNPSKSILYFTDSENENFVDFNLGAINLLERDDEELKFN